MAVVLGTRPELIKLAPVIRQFTSLHVPLRVIASGQHREMVRALAGPLDVMVDVDLDVMQPRQTLNALSARLISSLSKEFETVRPAAVIVQGDTTTALCAALAAYHDQIPVAHVEAGLRSGVRDDPFPEEMNRRLVSRLTTWHFPPTVRAGDNLAREGVDEGHRPVVGNTVIDNLHWVIQRGLGSSAFCRERTGPRVLLTLHRRENHGEVMGRIAQTIGEIAAARGLEVVFPVHPNPAVRAAVLPVLEGNARVTLTEPLDYLDFAASLAACDLVLTDSGGVQEEAPTLGKPALVLRDTTERPEAVEAGAARLVGTSPAAVRASLDQLLDRPEIFAAMSQVRNPYGDGHAAERIVDCLISHLNPSDPDPRVGHR